MAGGNADSPDRVWEGRLDEAHARIAELELALAVTTSVDPRTGMLSRNTFLDSVELAMHRMQRYDRAFGLLICALDPADDARHITAVLSASIRAIDRIATWDEWTLAVMFEGLAQSSWQGPWRRISDHLSAISARFVFASSPDAAAAVLVAAGEGAQDPGEHAVVITIP